MRIRNNCKEHKPEWLGYNCGNGVKVDILPDSEFEVVDKVGIFLLRLLGHENWLVRVPEGAPKQEAKPLDLEVEEQETVEVVEEPKTVVEKVKEKLKKKKDKGGCEECGITGGKHKLLCKKLQS